MGNTSYFSRLKQILKHPIVLLPTLIITLVWILLGFLQSRYKDSQALSYLNFFTFAQGGLFGGVAGAVGGIVGKILIASLLNALLMPLFIKGSLSSASNASTYKHINAVVIKNSCKSSVRKNKGCIVNILRADGTLN